MSEAEIKSFAANDCMLTLIHPKKSLCVYLLEGEEAGHR